LQSNRSDNLVPVKQASWTWCSCGENCITKYCRNKGYGINVTDCHCNFWDIL